MEVRVEEVLRDETGSQEREASSHASVQNVPEPAKNTAAPAMYFESGSQPTIINHAHNVRIREEPTDVRLREEESVLADQPHDFINYVNSRTSEQSRSTIAKDFNNEITEPTREVTPSLVITNFFRGESALDEVDYSVSKERGRRANTKKAREVKIQLQDIHKHGRYIMLVGGAGSGKTTLIKRYCKMVLDKKIENMKEIKVVHLINIRDLWNGELSPKDMLFGQFLVGEHKKDSVLHGYEWMQKEENQKKVLLAFDGIDTAPWVLSRSTHALMTYDNKGSAATIIYNILYGHLFSKCKLLLTSREYGISKFPQDIRPEKIIALRGLTRDGIMNLVKELGGDKGERIWKTILQKSLNLLLLCSTPLFLVFTVIVYKVWENPPENLSGIIITLLESHIHLESSRLEEEEVRGIIEKLKVLSRLGLLNGRVVFSEKELKDVGLKLDDIKDLVIRVPSHNDTNICNQRLLEKDYSYFFCHQAVQEALAGLCIAGESFHEFQRFVDEYLHLPKFIVVRQILCGVIFNEKTTSLAQNQAKILDHQRKKDYLLLSLTNELQKHSDSPLDTLNLLISLRECGEEKGIMDMIKQQIHKISLSGIPLTPSDLHAAASVARRCDCLSIMQLVNCHLDKYALEVLASGLKESDVEITVFDVSFNKNLRKDSMYNVHEVCVRGQGLNYWQCGFRQLDILNFNEQAPQPRMVEAAELSEEDVIRKSFYEDSLLDLACYNVENYPDVLRELVETKRSEESLLRLSLVEYEAESDMTLLCELLHNCDNVQELAISESEFTGHQLEQIKNSIQHIEIEALNIFLNPNIEERGWEALGNILKRCHLRNVFITACNLTDRKLQSFKFGLCGSKIFKLDISRNENMNEYCLKEIGEIVNECGVQELVMGYCNFKPEHMDFLRQTICNAKINRIDVSGNDKMGEKGFEALGEIVYKCNVKLLDVSECDPTPEEVGSFKNATYDAKITKLNFSRNRRMGESGLKSIGEIVGKCQLQEVFIRQCELDEKTLHSFRQGLGNSKIRLLDIGLYFMKPRKTTEREIEIIVDLLSNITEQLTLNAWDINEKGHRVLRAALNSLPFIGLKILFNRGRNEFISQGQP